MAEIRCKYNSEIRKLYHVNSEIRNFYIKIYGNHYK